MAHAVRIPAGLEYWTADEIAECLPFEAHLPKPAADALARKLWGFLESDNPTPAGGDGSDGTVETPDGRRDLGNTDKPRAFWGQLTPAEQTAIATAYRALDAEAQPAITILDPNALANLIGDDDDDDELD